MSDTIAYKTNTNGVERFNLSTNEDTSLNTFKIQAYELPKGTVNAIEYLTSLINKFPSIDKLVNSTMDEIEDIGSTIEQKFVDWVKGDTVTSLIAPAINEMFSMLTEAVEEADDGIYTKSNLSAVWSLDIPNSLQDSYSHQYSSNEFSLEEIMVRKAPTLLALKALSPDVAGKVEKMTSQYFEMSKRAGNTVDPNIITVFNNTNMREFNFVINIIPQNNEHRANILKGLLHLKQYMTGTKSEDNLYLQQTHCFILEFKNPKLQEYLNLGTGKAKTAVELNLVSLNITYGADGAMQFVNQGTNKAVPKHIQVAMTFQERRPLRRKIGESLTNNLTSKEIEYDHSKFPDSLVNILNKTTVLDGNIQVPPISESTKNFTDHAKKLNKNAEDQKTMPIYHRINNPFKPGPISCLN